MVDLFRFLRRRTNFRADHFRAPAELQQNLEEMERLRIPLELWNSFLCGAMRFVAFLRDSFDTETLVNYLFQIATELVAYWMDYWILKAALRIISLVSPQYLKSIIIFVYHFVNWAALHVWRRIEAKLKPYVRLALETLSTYTMPRPQAIEQ